MNASRHQRRTEVLQAEGVQAFPDAANNLRRRHRRRIVPAASQPTEATA